MPSELMLTYFSQTILNLNQLTISGGAVVRGVEGELIVDGSHTDVSPITPSHHRAWVTQGSIYQRETNLT